MIKQQHDTYFTSILGVGWPWTAGTPLENFLLKQSSLSFSTIFFCFTATVFKHLRVGGGGVGLGCMLSEKGSWDRGGWDAC